MSNVIELFPHNVAEKKVETRVDELAAEKAFLEYLAWSMQQEKDPHERYDDPVTEFRARNSKTELAC